MDNNRFLDYVGNAYAPCGYANEIVIQDQALFKCYAFPLFGSGSFICNRDGSSTITFYSDNQCSQTGFPMNVAANACPYVGTYGQAYNYRLSTSCFPPPAYTLSGYYKKRDCQATDDYFLYPLGTCTTFFGNSTDYVVYSVQRTQTEIKLTYHRFQLPDCADVGSNKITLFHLEKTCLSTTGYASSVTNTSLPALTAQHRYISFYPDNNCQGNVQRVSHVRDGCAAIPKGFAKFTCLSDGSSIVQMYGASDASCSQTPIGNETTVQPSTCFDLGTHYMTTTCLI